MIIVFGIYLLCSVGGLTLVKIGSENNGFILNNSFFNLSLSYATFIGLILYIASFLLWIVIVQKFDLSYIQPIALGLSNVLIVIVAILILKEHIGTFQWIGIALILVGVIFMNIKMK